MKPKIAVLVFLMAFAVGSSIVFLKIRSQQPPPPVTLPPVVRTYPPFELDDPEIKLFDEQVKALVKTGDYRGLDTLAQSVASEKSRFKGSIWKIFELDTIAAQPLNGGGDQTDWSNHIRFVQKWIKASPGSIYAKTALANAEVGFGGFYRGQGYANTVSETAWPKYLEHLSNASIALAEAGDLPNKYVGYHLANLMIARLNGAERSEYEKAYKAAIAFEPNYEYFYKQKAHYLLPRWSGQWGESESFAEQVKIALGTVEGVKMYSFIIGEMGRVHGGDYIPRHRISWDDVVRGFELREADYGPSRLRLNELAKLSIFKNDDKTTCEVFRRLDADNGFEPNVWFSRGEFNEFQATALNQICPNVQQNAEIKARFPHMDDPPGLFERIKRSIF